MGAACRGRYFGMHRLVSELPHKENRSPFWVCINKSSLKGTSSRLHRASSIHLSMKSSPTDLSSTVRNFTVSIFNVFLMIKILTPCRLLSMQSQRSQPPAGTPTPTISDSKNYEKHLYLQERLDLNMWLLKLRQTLFSQVMDPSTAHDWVRNLASTMVRPPSACFWQLFAGPLIGPRVTFALNQTLWVSPLRATGSL
jgi:hypothetical protein